MSDFKRWILRVCVLTALKCLLSWEQKPLIQSVLLMQQNLFPITILFILRLQMGNFYYSRPWESREWFSRLQASKWVRPSWGCCSGCDGGSHGACQWSNDIWAVSRWKCWAERTAWGHPNGPMWSNNGPDPFTAGENYLLKDVPFYCLVTQLLDISGYSALTPRSEVWPTLI